MSAYALTAFERRTIADDAAAYARRLSDADIRAEIAHAERTRPSSPVAGAELDAELVGLRAVLSLRAARTYRRTTANHS